ncbi:PAS and helix-turn-helix domain-containing protein [Mucilaginibacter psychrotolerans]|uniref:LuxR family transcriptional regulator n=1 Tax=Mucilaginibacter psychrotolerans TaxID=1524096 RepID=A0A4Y8SJK5_9SPHI|nr:PAS and helix-turn-helix domain-containing protein [Mucilaginibacter psychrotolerans]TFF38845.1 LuxR family transcriptional regulator [Mucilaginibacter psychrotolerans]
MLAINPKLPDHLKAKVEAYIPVFEQLPAVVIIHDIVDGFVAYLSPRGLTLLNTSMEEIALITTEEYHRRYFNDEDAQDYAPKLFDFMSRNSDEELISFFQQVRFAGSDNWHWHLSSLKIFSRDADGRPRLLIGLAIPVDAMHHMATKAERLLQENNFLRKNFKTFSRLTLREREVLRLTALGKSAAEVAAELFIAETTVETHRRNIKSKLQANTYFELSEYARAFDLI